MPVGRLQHRMGNLNSAINHLQKALVVAEQSGQREDEAKIRHRLGMAWWHQHDLENARLHLDLGASLFESIRREDKGHSDHKLSLFDLQTECLHVLQRVLVQLNRENEALVVAERCRTRAFVDLIMQRQGSARSASKMARFDDNTPKSVTDIVNLVNRQKASVIYYSLAAGYLYTWLIIPTRGIVKFHQVRVDRSLLGEKKNRILISTPISLGLPQRQ